MSFEDGSWSGLRVPIIILEGRVAACPTNIASCLRSPDSILVKPSKESGRIPRMWFLSDSLVILRTIQELHWERTVASTSLGRCDTRSNPTPYFLPSLAIRRIASCAASYWASPLLGTYRWASSHTSNTGSQSRSSLVCQTFKLNNVLAMTELAIPCYFIWDPSQIHYAYW